MINCVQLKRIWTLQQWKLRYRRNYFIIIIIIYSYFSPIYNFGPDLALFIYIFQYLALLNYIYPHLVIFTLNCPNLTIYAIFTLHL